MARRVSARRASGDGGDRQRMLQRAEIVGGENRRRRHQRDTLKVGEFEPVGGRTRKGWDCVGSEAAPHVSNVLQRCKSFDWRGSRSSPTLVPMPHRLEGQNRLGRLIWLVKGHCGQMAEDRVAVRSKIVGLRPCTNLSSRL